MQELDFPEAATEFGTYKKGAVLAHEKEDWKHGDNWVILGKHDPNNAAIVKLLAEVSLHSTADPKRVRCRSCPPSNRQNVSV